MNPDTSAFEAAIEQTFATAPSTIDHPSPPPPPPAPALSSTDFYQQFQSSTQDQHQGYRFPAQVASTSAPTISYTSSPQEQSGTPANAWLSPSLAGDVSSSYYSPPSTIHLPHATVDQSLAPPPMARNVSAPPPQSESWGYGYIPVSTDYTAAVNAASWQRQMYNVAGLDDARLETSSLPDLTRGASPSGSPSGNPQIESWLQTPVAHLPYPGLMHSPIVRQESPATSASQSVSSNMGALAPAQYWMPTPLKSTPPSSTASSPKVAAETIVKPKPANKPKRKRMHVCPQCGKDFNRPSALLLHNAVHTGERTNVCNVNGCNRSFSNISNLRRHQRQLHAAECNVPLPTTIPRRYVHPTPYGMPTPVGMTEARRQLFGML